MSFFDARRFLALILSLDVLSFERDGDSGSVANADSAEMSFCTVESVMGVELT